MQIYLVRHGKPKVVGEHFYESYLSEGGEKDVRRFALSGAIPKPHLIVSSPFNRARNTADVFSSVFGTPYEILDFLAEWRLQTLNLAPKEYMVEERKGWNNQKLAVKGGESLEDVKERMVNGALSLAADDRDTRVVLAVSHGIAITMLCAGLSGKEARLEELAAMKHLDYAILSNINRRLRLTKDIRSDKSTPG